MRAEDFFSELGRERPSFREAWAEEELSSNLATNVYRLRKERGWSQRDLAERAKMKQPKIAQVESGDANPELRTLGRLAAALGVTAAELLQGENEVVARDLGVRHEAVDYEIIELANDWGASLAASSLRVRTSGDIVANDNFALAG